MPHVCSTLLIGYLRAEEAGCKYQAESGTQIQHFDGHLFGTIIGFEKGLSRSTEGIVKQGPATQDSSGQDRN
jgi:hypothetical protein